MFFDNLKHFDRSKIRPVRGNRLLNPCGCSSWEETCRPLRKRGARIETAFGLLAAALSFQVAPCESEGRGLKRNGAMASKSVGQVAPCESEGRGLKQRRLQCWDWDCAVAPCESE